MTEEEAIRKIVQLAGLLGPFSPVTNALDKAVGALREQAEAEKNEPLKLDELRDMDGEPVWVVFTPDGDGYCLSSWALVSAENDSEEILLVNNIGGSSSYEEVSDDIKGIYRRKPEETT